jgi:hypothetical protein
MDLTFRVADHTLIIPGPHPPERELFVIGDHSQFL